jgi:parvulin-like peptidyl-prolyl isomerase
MTLVVNGERINDNEIEQEVERLRPRYEQVFAEKDPKERQAQLRDWSRDNVIERVLLRQEAKKNGANVPAAEIEAALARLREQFEKPEDLHAAFHTDSDDEVRSMIEQQMQVERKINDIYAGAAEPSDEEIRRYYEENKDQFQSGEQVRVAHIVKYVNWQTDEAAALEIIRRAQQEIKNGAAFEVVVDKYTDCADSGGDLGFVGRGQMVEEFEDVIFKLGVGQVSDVFRTRFGFHLAKVYSHTPPRVPELKEIKARVVKELKEQMKEQALGDYLDELRRKAAIEDL